MITLQKKKSHILINIHLVDGGKPGKREIVKASDQIVVKIPEKRKLMKIERNKHVSHRSLSPAYPAPVNAPFWMYVMELNDKSLQNDNYSKVFAMGRDVKSEQISNSS